MDAMREAAEVQPAKRVCSDTRVGNACNAARALVIIDEQHFQHRKSDLQTLRREVICNRIDSLLCLMTSKAAGFLQWLPMVSDVF